MDFQNKPVVTPQQLVVLTPEQARNLSQRVTDMIQKKMLAEQGMQQIANVYSYSDYVALSTANEHALLKKIAQERGISHEEAIAEQNRLNSFFAMLNMLTEQTAAQLILDSTSALPPATKPKGWW